MSTSFLPTAEVSSYSDIQEFLAQLGPPAPGRKRVLRGQNKGYVDSVAGLPSLLPALARDNSDHTYDPAWLVSIQMYSMTIQEEGAYTPLDLLSTWGPALLQHYGPGSSYLDVTSDLDVALWFALYQRHEKWLVISHADGLPRSLCCAWYTAAPEPAGVSPVLYVFDAPSWDGAGTPAHGELVELTAISAQGKLPQEARRLHQQIGSLLCADIKHAGGPNLGPQVVAMLHLSPNFAKATVPSYGRTVPDVFPLPSADPFYKALLEIPAQIQFDPARLEHPLAIPCYLPEPPILPASEAEGNRKSPLKLSNSDEKNIAGLSTFAALGAALEPDLMLGHAVAGNPSFGEPMIPTTADGKQFRLADATPFMLEGPLWSYLPSCQTEDSRGEWIQSALPIGIAPFLANRPTDNVYIEMSTVDVLYPEKESADVKTRGSAVRGIWMVHAGNRYWCTVYWTADGGLLSYQAEFRFIPQMGRFIRDAPEKENELTEQARQDLQRYSGVVEKALFTTLLLLRDLSPGFKPPSTYSERRVFEDGSFARTVGVVLEPQLGNIHCLESAPFLVPRALNGGTYARASGSGSVDCDAWKKSDEGFAALKNAFAKVKDSFYLMEAGGELAELYRQRNQLKEALDVTRYALASAQTTPASPHTTAFCALLEVMQGRTLYDLHDQVNSLKAFKRAMSIQEDSGDQARLTETQSLVAQLFPSSTASSGGLAL